MLGLPPEWQVSNLSFVHSGTKENFIFILGLCRRKGNGALQQERWRIDIKRNFHCA